MASSYSTDLKLELMVTGEKAGLWGDITNTNLVIVSQAIAGYESVTLNATTGATLAFTNGATSNGKNAVLNLAGTITGNVDVTIPDGIEKTYIIKNATSGAFTVTVKTTSGSGVTWAAADKGTKVVYSNGTDVIDTGLTDLASDYSPQLSAQLDVNGQSIGDGTLELLKFTEAASAVNEVTVGNAATGNAPSLSATGDDTNVDFNLTPKGIGRVTLNGNGKIQGVAEKVTTSGTFDSDVVIDTNTQGVILSTAAANANFIINLRGDGSNSLDASLDTGESVTVAYISKQNATAYYPTEIQCDGVTTNVTTVWQGGSAPSSGNVTSNDIYTITAIKTASSTYTVLASQTQFA